MSDQISVSKIKPLPGYVLVEPAEAESKTKSGIYLPGKEDEKHQYGKVLAVSNDAHLDGVKTACPVKKGALVIYKKWGGDEFEVKEQKLQFIKFNDLLAVIG